MDKNNFIETQIEPLLDYFKKAISLNKGNKHLLITIFQLMLYRKRQYVLQNRLLFGITPEFVSGI